MKARNKIGFLLVGILLGVVEGAIEFCSPGRSNFLYRLTQSECPYGVLFKFPVASGCFQAGDDVDNYFADLCMNVKFNSNPSQIQLISSIDDSEVPETCEGPPTETQTKKCKPSATQLIDITKDNLTPPKLALKKPNSTRNTADEVPPEYRNDPKVLAQTKRMFRYIINLKYPTEEEREKRLSSGYPSWSYPADPMLKWKLNTPPRIIKMLELSFLIVGKHVDDRFVPQAFKKDIENAFVFLLQETFQSNGILADIPEDDFGKIMTSLEKCLAHQVPWTGINGTRCRTFSEIDLITKGKRKIAPKVDEFYYKPGVYDLPVDGAWATLAFVHGLCYGTFREYVNYHHLYERAIEKLFNLNEIAYRWKRPPLLFHERLWNKMFSTPNVNQTMKNLDAFVQAAYSGSPFLHRIERTFPGYRSGDEGGGDGVARDAGIVDEGGTPEVQEIPPGSRASGPAPERDSSPDEKNDKDGTTTDGPPAEGGSSTTEGPAPAPAPEGGDAPAPATEAPASERKKRSLSKDDPIGDMMYDTSNFDAPLTLEEIGMKEGGWCFQTEEEQMDGIMYYIFEKCEGAPITKDIKSNLPWLFKSESSEESSGSSESGKDEL